MPTTIPLIVVPASRTVITPRGVSLPFCVGGDEHRALAVVDNSMRNAAAQQRRPRWEPARPHDDEVGAVAERRPGDLLGGAAGAGANAPPRSDAAPPEPGDHLLNRMGRHRELKLAVAGRQ